MAEPTFCQVAKRGIDELIDEIAQPTTNAAAKVFAKPYQLFQNYGERVRGAMLRIMRYSAAQESRQIEGAKLYRMLKAVRFAGWGRDEEAVKRAFTVLDLVPSRVLAGLGKFNGKWDGDEVVKRTMAYLQGFDRGRYTNASAFDPKRFYDPRFVDIERFDAGAVREAITNLTPNQRKAVVEYAKHMRMTRAESLRAKLATNSSDIYLRMRQAALEGKTASATPQELVKGYHEKVMDEAGLTVSSYISHFVMDAAADANADDMVWKLGKLANFQPVADKLHEIMLGIPDVATLRANFGTDDRARYVAQQLSEWLAGETQIPVAELLSVIDTPRYRQLLIDSQLLTNPTKNVRDIMKLVPRRAFVPYLKARLRRTVARDLSTIFEEFPQQMAVIQRQTFMEPAYALGMTVLGDFGTDKTGQRAWQNWLREMLGVPSPYGMRYLLGGVPGARNALNKIESASIKLAYWKALYGNLGSALVNATQILQFGTGPQGAYHYTNGLRMLNAEDGFFIERLSEMYVSSHSFSTVGGQTSAGLNPMKELRAELRDWLELAHTASSPEEAWRLYTRGGARTMLGALEFMGHVEKVLRVTTGAQAMHRSAVAQLLETIPGAKVVRDGLDFVVQGADGTRYEPIVELRKAYAAMYGSGKARVWDAARPLTNAERAEQARRLGTVLNWKRVADDVTNDNIDLNFVLSSANYSEFERTVRTTLPIVGKLSGTFMNYTLHAAARVGTDIWTGVKFGMQQAADAAGVTLFRQRITSAQAEKASRRLLRYAAGTYLIAGPYAFRPMIDASLKVASLMDSSIPSSTDDPRIKGQLDALEAYSLGGALGIDMSTRIGINVGDVGNFFFGNRFVDNPASKFVTNTLGGFAGVHMPNSESATPQGEARQRYAVLGRFAEFFDQNRDYGNSLVGRDFPLVPIFLYNYLQMATDAYDIQHYGHTFDALGKAADPNLPTEELVKRGVMGRTIYDREKMRALAETRPKLAARLTDIRSRFVDAWFSRDMDRARALNDEYAALVPMHKPLPEGAVHPDLQVRANDASRYALERMQPAEFRQLRFAASGVARVELDRAVAQLQRLGYMKSGVPDVRAIERDNDPLATRALLILQAVISRPVGQQAWADQLP